MKKNDNIVVVDTKIYQKIKNKSLNEKKCLIIITRNYYLKNNDLESYFDEKYKDVFKIRF